MSSHAPVAQLDGASDGSVLSTGAWYRASSDCHALDVCAHVTPRRSRGPERRTGVGEPERLPALAAGLVARKVDVIYVPMMEGPWCRFRREARARERHRHCSGG